MKLTRPTLMKSLAKRFPKMFLKTTEEFGIIKGGVWTSGEDHYKDEEGNVLFDYYGEYGDYTFGVHTPFAEWVEKRGWFCEWYDPGTMMIWPL